MKNFKNKVLTCISAAALLFASASNVQAQKGEFGVRFMPTFSDFDMKNSDGGTADAKGTMGLGAGIFGAFNFSKHIGIQSEIMYSSVTQKYKEPSGEKKVNLRYINIPVLLSLNTNKTKRVNFNIGVGPQLGISVGSRVFSSGNDSTAALLTVKKGDLGFAYGGGFDFGLNESKTIRLGIGFRGVYGLFDISNNNGTHDNNSYYIVDKANIKTYSGYIGLSVLLGKPKE